MTTDPHLIAQLDGFDEIGRLVRVLAQGEPWRSAELGQRVAPAAVDLSPRVPASRPMPPPVAAPSPMPPPVVVADSELEALERVSLGDLAGDFGP